MFLYFSSISIAMIAALFLFLHRIEHKALNLKIAMQVYLVIMVSALVGARLVHVIYEEPIYYTENLLRIFQLWEGGFVFYGGFLLALASGILFLRYKNVDPIENYMDASAPVISLGYIIGRVGCLLIGCCYGKPTGVPWAMNHRHPTQLYAIAWDSLLIIMILFVLEKRRQPLRSGYLFYIWLILHALGRIIMELYRDDYRGDIHFVSLSTWISLMLIVLSLILMLNLLLKERREKCQSGSI